MDTRWEGGSRPVWALTIVGGAQAGRALRVDRPRRVIVGRDQDCDWAIDDCYVSRHHVLLEVSPPQCRLRDLGVAGAGSRNAPRHNGRPVRYCELRDGDLLVLGATTMRVSVESGPAPPDPGRAPAHGAAPVPEPPRRAERVPVFCPSCGADLSHEANSDGRAADLAGSVFYLCSGCLAPGDRFAGRKVGPYELRSCIGEGGMGTVYLAYHRETARLLVLKRITDLTDPVAVRRFSREVRILALMAHPRVLRLLDSGADAGGALFLATEYMEGGNLEHLLQREGLLPPALAVALACQVLEGLHYLHHNSVIHRDVKPENILLRRGAGPPSVALADFGISHFYEQAGGTRLTKPNTRIGTLMFMPPEQVRDAAEARETADIYAAGVTLYYLLTGCYSFDFPTPAQIRQFQVKARAIHDTHQMVREILRLERVRHPFRVILEDEPIPLLKRAPGLPRALAAAVDRAVRKLPQARFATAEEFRLELSRACA
jgi:serine/threonine protein kinase